jgi:hemin uptake protein HemP
MRTFQPRNAPETLCEDAKKDSLETTRRIDSASLLRGCQELVIRHAGQDYRLRITRQGKLILTK